MQYLYENKEKLPFSQLYLKLNINVSSFNIQKYLVKKVHHANIWKRIFRWNLSCIIYKLRLIEQSWVFIFGFVSKIWFTIAKKAVQTTYAQIIIVQGKTVHASNRTLAENKPSNGKHAGFAWRKYAAYVYFRFIQHAAFALMRLYKYKEVC